MAGNQEENGEQSAQRESRGTAEDVEENRRKMWEVKATDAVWGGKTERSQDELGLPVNNLFVNTW